MMLEWIRVTGTDGEHYEVPTRAHDAIAEAERESANVELRAYRKRIAELEAALATVGEVAAGAYTAQENGQDDVSVALAAIMDEVDTVLEGDDE